MKIVDMTNKNEVVKQYIPLINKIANQINASSGHDRDECVSVGAQGLLYAIDHYKEDEGKKKQTFTQYAAYMIRFFILNDINKNGHTIRVNQNQQKKLKDEGKSIDITTSLDRQLHGISSKEDGDNITFGDVVRGDSEDSIYNSIDPSAEEMWKIIFSRLSVSFSNRDIDIFYSTFGINDHEEMSGKDMAKRYGISAGAVTQVRNKIIKYMREDKELRNILLEILNR